MVEHNSIKIRFGWIISMLGPPTVLDRNECFERVNFFGLPLPPRELSETATRTTPAERRKHSQAKPRKRSPDRPLHTGNQEKELTCLHSKGIFPSLPPQMETVSLGYVCGSRVSLSAEAHLPPISQNATTLGIGITR